ncbi:MAG: type II toxin-antitoxin system MqsR family toxin [Deltaproteobacteria bacterium]|nr:type II toxin-antitoxin system MqsR family toxin [Deltaproteobacteria bacterium]
MTDKKKRVYPLPEVKRLIWKDLIIDPSLNVRQGATDVGLSVYEAHQEILTLESRHFYKSTTEIFNHTVWQDVYKKEIKGISVYIKFKICEGKFLLTSFKPDETEER